MTLIQPDNSIIVSGEPRKDEIKVEVAANMFPGRVVIQGTNDDDAVIAGAGCIRPMGWLGYENTHKFYRPATSATIYTINDQASLLSGGDFRLLAKLASGEIARKGEFLVVAPAGMLKVASAMTVTIASGTIAVVSDKAQPDELVIGAYGSEGIIVAKADEYVDASLAAADIIVLSLI